MRLRRPLGLRARVTVAFGIGALLLSVTLAALTYGLARRYLLSQREASTLRQAALNAERVRDALRASEPDLLAVLARLETGDGTRPVLFQRGESFAASLAIGRDGIPPPLRDLVRRGTPARQRFVVDGLPHLATGIPIPAQEAAYFEVVPLRELRQTLRTLAASLMVASVVTTLFGLALGRWASRRVLDPLREAAAAASALEAGRLDARLEGTADADLAVLVTSFNRMAGALQARIERDARFAADVSHELRSPLTTLVTAVDLLEVRRDELSPAGRQALRLVADEVRRFEGMVTDLLEISRTDAGVVDIVLEEVRLGELVLHAMDRVTQSKAPVDLDANAANVVVQADKRRLERVIANLVDNAESHGGGLLRVELHVADGRVRLAVEDAGPGVPVDQRERVFEAFSRGSGAGARGSGGGVGLGLALVAEHVRLHGGQVWVEDRVGGGARFVVELPTAPS